MDSHFYLDIRVIESAEDTDLKLEHICNQVYRIIHGAFRQLAIPYALALETSSKLQNKQNDLTERYGREPQFHFDIFRIFAQQAEQLQQLIEAIQSHWRIRDYTVLGSPLHVPSAKITGWKSYRRFRIPSRKAERTRLSQINEPLRDRRLRAAKNMPYLQVTSQTTGQGFTLIIDIQPSDNAGYGLPDSYGLARKDNPFALPVF